MNLPPVMRDLVSLIGTEAVVLLLEAHILGCNWRISKTRDSDFYREWSDIIGDGLTDKVVQAWGGEDRYFPNCKPVLYAERNATMIARYDAMLQAGTSTRRAVRQLCRDYRLSDWQVKNIVNRPTPERPPDDDDVKLSAQLGLF